MLISRPESLLHFFDKDLSHMMSRSILEILRNVFTSEYWLVVSLCGAFFSFFALNRGGVVVFIEASFILILINFVSGKYLLKKIPVTYWVTLAICAYLLGTSALLHPNVSHYRWMANLVRMLCVVFAIHCLSQKKIGYWTRVLFFAVLSFAVCWQITAYYFFKMPYGTFSNQHYLSNFLILALPVIVYSILSIKAWFRFVFIPVALFDIDILLKLASRPSNIAIAFGTLFALIFFVGGWRKWVCLLLFCGILAGVLLSDYGHVYTRFEQLISTLPDEERVKVWIAVWHMLKDNSLMTWIFGNGIGAYHGVYLQYIAPEVSWLNFPHLHFLELCYENGIIGTILTFGGIAALFFSSIKAVRQTEKKNIRILIECMIVALICWMIHAGLTFPFYSKYSQYGLAFILGTLLAVLNDPACNRDRALIAQNANAKLR